MSTQEPVTWREFLGQLIGNVQMRMQLADAIHVRSITLQRWAEGISTPRNENIFQLVKHIPKESYTQFTRLLSVDYPDLLSDDLPDELFHRRIPTEFYARAMSNLAHTPVSIYRQSMQDLILQQMLQHLDPDQNGLAIMLVMCVTPRQDDKVRSLYELGGLATSPWPHNVMARPMLLGTESLVGYAIAHAHACTVNSRHEMTFFPVQWIEYEQSTTAFPILYHAQIIGGLVISSTQEFFFTPRRLSVIEGYAHLATCIFEQEQSFDSKEIALMMMPSLERQRPYFSNYSQRVSQKLVRAQEMGEQLNWQQARQAVWQDLEDLLLQLDLPPDDDAVS
jgi:hypothetical protein